MIRAATRPGAAFAALIVLILALPAAYALSLANAHTLSGLRAGSAQLGGLGVAGLDAALDLMASEFASAQLVLTLAGERHVRRRGDAGLALDREALRARAIAAGRSGQPWRDMVVRLRARRGALDLGLPARLDRGRALAFAETLKAELDRPALDARFDLDRRVVAAEEPGLLVDVYGSLANLATATRDGSFAKADQAPDVALAGVVTEPRRRRADLAGIDISSVLGVWETRFSQRPTDENRASNLRLAAERLDGRVLMPGEQLSFNETVGDRTPEAGFRVATVIASGELVDGWAGGVCQISSTLHAASFFAGLDIVRHHAHSRPSAYIPMALDATVVYPSVDLVVRNAYDFPVVLHFKVALGRARAEILGKPRPYTKVAFERETVSTTPYQTMTRHDPELPAGQQAVDQIGIRGFHLLRRRVFITGTRRKPVEERREEWKVYYPSTTEIIRRGSKKVTGKIPPPPPPPKIPGLLQNPAALLRIEK